MRYTGKQGGNAGNYRGFYRKIPGVEFLEIAGKWLDGKGTGKNLDFA